MKMRIYNTLTRRIEEIVPIEPGKIKMYSCGPTVYRYIHIGNLRTFTMADWLRRTLEYLGFTVLHVKNITDVGHMRHELLDRGEDKILAQARKEGKTSSEIAQFYTEAFHRDEAKLNILPAHIFPRATEHIPEMIAIIAGLLQKGFAYEAHGYVYFDIQRFPDYGKLSGNLLEYMRVGVHEGHDADRRHPEDFPLWKPAEPGRDMAWESPWGRGFPGWHIECSAMSMKYLGPHFDIHTGGVDNIFPHHEDEIAQSEAYSGQPFVNYWVHAQHLLADGQKMAKSESNDYTCAEIEARGFDPLALRYFYTTALYRSRLNFTFSALEAAQIALERLRERAYRLWLQADQERALLPPSDEDQTAQRWRERFRQQIEDDLNIPRAMAVVQAMLRSEDLTPTAKVQLLLDCDRVLGFDLRSYLLAEAPRRRHDPQIYLQQLPAQLAEAVQQRTELRRRGDYPQADALRALLQRNGYRLQDGPEGTLVIPRRLSEEFPVLSRWQDAPDYTATPALYEFSLNLLARNNRSDLERCLESLRRYAAGRSLEVVILENGSTDDTLDYLRRLAREGELSGEGGERLSVQVLFADHNLGFAAGRNATMRASRGAIIVWLDTSVELTDAIWTPLARTLADPQIGLTGAFGLVTDDLREFREDPGPDVDAIEGYLLAFRRPLLSEVGWLNEKFRFYRLADVHYSFFFKAAGYRVVVTPELAPRLIRHPHREWYSLLEEERRTKSKKNYDVFRARWHHGQSLLVACGAPAQRWYGHDHSHHVDGVRHHALEELPPPGQMHTHEHRHWPDHAHTHAHYHQPAG
jgi:cysteinyl-tRNA synthetase